MKPEEHPEEEEVNIPYGNLGSRFQMKKRVPACDISD